MVLPTNVTKAFGPKQALTELGLTAHDVAAVRDGENDHSPLELAADSAAVANAVPALKKLADPSLVGEGSTGVLELMRDLLQKDLSEHANHERQPPQRAAHGPAPRKT